jgi:aminopeptidase 2
VIKNGGLQEYQAMKKLYLDTKTVDQKLSALSTLGYTENKDLIKETMEYALSEEVRNQDIIYILGTLGSNPASRLETWEFVKDKFEHFSKLFSSSLGLLGRVVSFSVENFASKDMADDVRTFYQSKDTSKFQRPLDQSLEKITIQTAWLERERHNIENWAQNL